MSTGLSAEFIGLELDRGDDEHGTADGVDRNQFGEVFNGAESPWQKAIEDLFPEFQETPTEDDRRETIVRLRNYLREVHGAIQGARLIHDVMPNTTAARSKMLLRKSVGRKYKGGLFWWVWHGDHTHIVHDCSWTAGYCRCVRMLGLPIKRPYRRFKSIGRLSERYLFNLTNYLLQPPRQFYHYEYAGRKRQPPDRIEDISYSEIAQLSEESMVETSGSEDEFFEPVPGGSAENPSRQTRAHSSHTYSRNHGHQKRSEEEELLLFLRHNPTSPILNITQTRVWLNSKYKFVRRSDARFQNVCDVFNLSLLNLDIEQMYEFLAANTPLFQAYQVFFDTYYFTIVESIDIILELLLFQCRCDEGIKVFLSDLWNICDRKLPKINCFHVQAPPSSGKNFFFDSVLAFYISYGQIGNFNKFSNFPLQECVNKRILLWNEPNCEASAYDTLKMLFGGDPVNVKIKYQADAIVSRTPIICLSNYNPFPTESSFSMSND